MVCCINDCCGAGSYCCAHANPHSHYELMGEPILDPAYSVEMTRRERDALMQADDWSFCLDRFFFMEGVLSIQSGATSRASAI